MNDSTYTNLGRYCGWNTYSERESYIFCCTAAAKAIYLGRTKGKSGDCN